MEDPEQLDGETEPSDAVSDVSDDTDTTGDSWENVGLPSERDEEEEVEKVVEDEGFGNLQQPPLEDAARSKHKEILGLCRSQHFLPYVLLVIFALAHLRRLAQPQPTGQLDPAYLSTLQETFQYSGQCSCEEEVRARRQDARRAGKCEDKVKRQEMHIRKLERATQQHLVSAEEQLQQMSSLEQQHREWEADLSQRYEQLKDALHESERLRREENAEWKQKHEGLRVHLAESQRMAQEAHEEVQSLKKKAEHLNRRGKQDHKTRWMDQVEDFGHRMSEEWRRHAHAHGHPFIGEWWEHARKETEEVAEKLRKKYEQARDRGQKAACGFSRKWGFKGCREH